MSISYEEFLNQEADMIADMLEENSRIEAELADSERKIKPLTIKEKKLILSELKEIEDIVFDDKETSTTIVFHFKPISLYLDNGSMHRALTEEKKPFYYLWKLGFIDFKTSPSRVTMRITPTGISFVSNYDNDNKRNFHDWGLNCWGGWRNTISGLIKDKQFYDAALHIVSRMKQATVNDGISSYSKMCAFEYETKPYVLLNDQEFDFYKNEILWLTRGVYRPNYGTGSSNWNLDTENNVYYMDLIFQNHTYRLAISIEMHTQILQEGGN